MTIVPDPRRVVLALGGNALEGAPGSVADQATAAQRALESLRSLLAADHLLISHGNGPQVGTLLLRTEAPIDGYDLPPLPLDVCVADTVGGLGYMIVRELRGVLDAAGVARESAAVITTTLVGSLERAPRKAVGPSCGSREIERLRARGCELREDGRGRVRRVVPSPEPVRVLEIDVIRRLYDAGVAVVAGGGGGVPLVRRVDGSLVGVEAVIDKDLVASLIAAELRADLLMILTDIEYAYAGYGAPGQQPLGTVDVARLRALLREGAFGEGSMAPKVEAACRFIEAGGGRAVICHLDHAVEAAAGRTGTQVVAA